MNDGASRQRPTITVIQFTITPVILSEVERFAGESFCVVEEPALSGVEGTSAFLSPSTGDSRTAFREVVKAIASAKLARAGVLKQFGMT